MKFSLIVPVYNVEAYIEECLQSVLKQTYQEEVECILINDGTQDGSMDVVKRVLTDYTGPIEFRIFNHEKNKGLSAARNTGIMAACGEYVYFLDSDDEILPDCLQKFLMILDKYPGIDFIIGGMQVSGADIVFPLFSEPIVYGEEIFTDYVYQKWNAMACNKLINRKMLIEKKLFFAEGRLHEDLVFSFELALCASRMACLNTSTYLYKIRKKGAITSELGLQNMQDKAWGICHNFMLIRKNIAVSTLIPVYHYVATEVFHYFYLLSINKRIDAIHKKVLYKEIIQNWQNMKSYQRSLGGIIGLKALLLQLPFEVIKIIFKFLHTVLK